MDHDATTGAPDASVVAFVPDLLDRSRIESAGRRARRVVVFVDRPEDLPGAVAGGARQVVLDLGRPGALEILAHLGEAHSVGFASHVDAPLLEAAVAAGCDEVLPRSVFFRRMAGGEPFSAATHRS